MPDQIAVIDGREAFAYAGPIPWHRKGTGIADCTSGPDMLEKATLDWEVIENDLYFFGQGSDGAQMRKVEDVKTLTRSVDGFILATVNQTYTVIQNSEVADFAQALLGEGVQFETAGALYNGRIIFLSAMVPDRVINIPGDISPILPRLILTTGHDALHAFRLKNTPERTVCANTLDANLKGKGREFSIRHTKTALDRVAAARQALGWALSYLDEFEATMVKLTEKRMTLNDVKRFTEKLMPGKATAERRATTEAQRSEIIGLYLHADNLRDLPETAYRLYNAVSEYADHDRIYRPTKLGSADDARAVAVLDGTAQTIKDKTLDLLLSSGRAANGRFATVSAN